MRFGNTSCVSAKQENKQTNLDERRASYIFIHLSPGCLSNPKLPTDLRYLSHRNNNPPSSFALWHVRELMSAFVIFLLVPWPRDRLVVPRWWGDCIQTLGSRGELPSGIFWMMTGSWWISCYDVRYLLLLIITLFNIFDCSCKHDINRVTIIHMSWVDTF